MGKNGMQYMAQAVSVDITPPTGVWLVGYGGRDKPSDSTYHALRACALALSDGTEDLMIITADWLGFYERTKMFRETISQRTGIPEKNIILCGSHTHTGPSVGRAKDIKKGRYGEKDENYFKEAFAKITDIAAEAHSNMAPSWIKTGSTTCDIACSRRKPTGAGKVYRQMQPSPDSPTDHEVPVITIHSAQGDLKAVVFSYACHPTASGAITSIGADYVGFACDRIKEKFPRVETLFMQGFGGDQKPLNPHTGTFAHEIKEIKEHGDKLGDSVLGLIKSGLNTHVEGEISVKQRNLTLKMKSPDEKTLEEALAGSDEEKEWARYVKESRDSGEELETEIFPFEIQTVRFNNTLALVTLAGEITVEHGLRLKKAAGSHFKQIIPVGYANDIVAYIPVRRQIPEGGYEVLASQMLNKRVGPFEDSTEDRIHSAVMEML